MAPSDKGTPQGRKNRDNWDKAEILSKIVGGASIPIIGLLITLALQHVTEQNRHTEVYANVIAEREKADSEIRAQAFNSLMQNYLGKPMNSTQQIPEDFRSKIMVLDLLVDNFQDYFDPEPLFYALHEQIQENAKTSEAGRRQAWDKLDRQLIGIAQRTSSRQVALLERVGTADVVDVPLARSNALEQPPRTIGKTKITQRERSLRVALYPISGLSNVGDTFYLPAKSLAKHEFSNNDDRFSISIEVHDMTPIAAEVSVFLYKDVYSDDKFEPEESKLVRKIDFEVSYFASPYMDNTRLVNGSRFAILYLGCFKGTDKRACSFPVRQEDDAQAQFRVAFFREEFLSQRDRPYLDQIIQQAAGHSSWW
jgi:hypothetical protein